MLWEFTKQLKAPGSGKMLANKEQRGEQNATIDKCIITFFYYVDLYSLHDIISERT